MSELWYFFTLSECFPCRHSTFCCCNLSRQCCKTVATFYVPTEMSPCFASGASKMMSVDSHKCFQTDNVLVTQTLFCRFNRSHWMSAKCQQLGVSNHFRLIKKVKEKKKRYCHCLADLQSEQHIAFVTKPSKMPYIIQFNTIPIYWMENQVIMFLLIHWYTVTITSCQVLLSCM